MRKTIISFMKFTGALDTKDYKARFFHPIGFIVFFIFIIPAIITCIFIEEGLIGAIKENYKLF